MFEKDALVERVLYRRINVSDSRRTFYLEKFCSLLISATFLENRGQNILKNLTFWLKGHIFVIKNKLLPTSMRFDNGE